MSAAEILAAVFFRCCLPSLRISLVVANDVCYNYKKRSFENAMEEV